MKIHNDWVRTLSFTTDGPRLKCLCSLTAERRSQELLIWSKLSECGLFSFLGGGQLQWLGLLPHSQRGWGFEFLFAHICTYQSLEHVWFIIVWNIKENLAKRIKFPKIKESKKQFLPPAPPDSDLHQNVMGSFMTHTASSHQVPWLYNKSLLNKHVHKQINQQINGQM